MLSEVDLAREAAATGFRAEVLEKVIRLIELLETTRSHPFLKERVALKGGTALNLFVLDVPRLSVDVDLNYIDLNYIGAADRDTMLAERPKVEQAVQAVCGRLGIQVIHHLRLLNPVQHQLRRILVVEQAADQVHEPAAENQRLRVGLILLRRPAVYISFDGSPNDHQ